MLKVNNPDTKQLKDTLLEYGLKLCIESPTRYDFSESCLDLIFCNSDNIYNSGVINSNISDHEIIFITRKLQVRYSGKITFTGRSYKHYNVNSFQEKLTSMNWEDYYRLDNPDLLWDNMERKISQILDGMCPYKTYSVKETKEPWVTPEVLEQIKRKDEIWRAAKRSKDSRKNGISQKVA